MNLVRNTYIKHWVLIFLLAGLAGQFLIPLSASAKKASFANWLNHNVVSGDDYKELLLRNEIRNLSNRADDFSGLVKTASRFVLENKDNFQIPLNKNQENESKSIKSWLVDQWTAFQKTKSKQDAIKSDWNHIYPRWLSQSFNLVKTICKDIAEKFFTSENISLSKRIVIIQNSPIPFLNGISINAP